MNKLIAIIVAGSAALAVGKAAMAGVTVTDAVLTKENPTAITAAKTQKKTEKRTSGRPESAITQAQPAAKAKK